MTTDDRELFVTELVKLGEMYHVTLSRLLLELYWDALKDYRLDDVSAAMRASMRSERRFPVAAVLIDYVRTQMGRRRAEEHTHRALPPAADSEEERAKSAAAKRQFRELVNGVSAKLSGRRRVGEPPPSATTPTPASARSLAAEHEGA